MKSLPLPSTEEVVALPSGWIKSLLPFHLAVNRQGRVVQCGEVLASFIGDPNNNLHLFDLFDLERPIHGDTPESAQQPNWLEVETRRLWILKHKNSPLRIKGSWQIHGENALLLANMWICSLEELNDLGLSIADFPVHELAGDHLLLLQQQAASIKDMRELSQSLATARDTAQDASKAKSSFLATMSHEIRTPMNGVIGLTEALKDTPLDDGQLDLISTIQSSADHLMQIINDILDFSKVEAGELRLVTEPTDFKKLLREVVAICQTSAADKDISLSLHVESAVPHWLQLDPTRFRQVLMNLLSNAIKFTQQGGNVDVSVDVIDAKIHIAVADNGVGIEHDDLAAIFEPFKQAEEGVRRGASGTGLGLAICKHIMESMDGELVATSTPGVGSTFTVSFESNICNPPAALETRESEQFQARLLVVDDNPVNLKVAVRLFTKIGCETTQARSGLEAIELHSSPDTDFDIIFMDCHMPEMDGFEATRQIRSTDPKTPIIALTADVLEEARIECIKAGMNDVLTKPIAIRSVKTALKKHLQD